MVGGCKRLDGCREARDETRDEWELLAHRYQARFAVIECVCSDLDLHRSRIEGRDRVIPGWYELDWEHVRRGRDRYGPLREPRLVLDAVASLSSNTAVTFSPLAVCAARLTRPNE